MSVLVFVLALPLAVWCLAALYAIVDGPELATAIRGLCLRIAAILAFVGLFGATAHAPLLWAFVVVGLLHLSASVILRWLIVHKGGADDAH